MDQNKPVKNLTDGWVSFMRIEFPGGGTIDRCHTDAAHDPNEPKPRNYNLNAGRTWFRLNGGNWVRSDRFASGAWIVWRANRPGKETARDAWTALLDEKFIFSEQIRAILEHETQASGVLTGYVINNTGITDDNNHIFEVGLEIFGFRFFTNWRVRRGQRRIITEVECVGEYRVIDLDSPSLRWLYLELIRMDPIV